MVLPPMARVSQQSTRTYASKVPHLLACCLHCIGPTRVNPLGALAPVHCVAFSAIGSRYASPRIAHGRALPSLPWRGLCVGVPFDQRTPSWTDRILWRCGGAAAIQQLRQLAYYRVEAMNTSDHMPVAASFGTLPLAC